MSQAMNRIIVHRLLCMSTACNYVLFVIYPFYLAYEICYDHVAVLLVSGAWCSVIMAKVTQKERITKSEQSCKFA